VLNYNDTAIGKTLGEINLAEFDVEVNSVRRHNVEGSQPANDMVLRAGDVLMLLGEPASLLAAEKRLRGDSYPG
jgi:CPA2 family monovalent cation:H+ antiporter-2